MSLPYNQLDNSMHVNQLGKSSANRKFYCIVKRLTDIFGALVAIFLFTPVMATIAVLIKLENPGGTVFYKQIRVGQHNKRFVMYKFRSMVCNADELFEQLRAQSDVQGKMFKMKDDPRLTNIGKIIRKTSLDELPQLLHVLFGDMSLVGPRPPLEREVQEYNSIELLRLSVKPGCTGLWQVSARNTVGFKEMLEMDFEYISKSSWWYDMILILRTFPAMFGRKGAF